MVLKYPDSIIKTYQTSKYAWLALSDFSYTLNRRAIVIAVAHLHINASISDHIDIFVMDRKYTLWYRDEDPILLENKAFDKTVCGVFEPGTTFNISICTANDDTVTISSYNLENGAVDARYCYCEYLVIPI